MAFLFCYVKVSASVDCFYFSNIIKTQKWFLLSMNQFFAYEARADKLFKALGIGIGTATLALELELELELILKAPLSPFPQGLWEPKV